MAETAVFPNLLLVGCGNMGRAMVEGWLRAGVSPQRIRIVDPAARDLPARLVAEPELPQGERFEVVLLAVKPQALDGMAEAVRPLSEGALILSVLAGVELASLSTRFPEARSVCRMMPNLAAALGKSPVALVGEGLSASDRALAEAVVNPLGTAEWVDENAIDLVTALAGSGPAFVYRFIDALAEAAADMGLPRAQADRLALAMVDGAAALAAASDADPGTLAARVSSPGGVTLAGLSVLDNDRAMVRLMRDVLDAAAKRSAEMAAEARGTRG